MAAALTHAFRVAPLIVLCGTFLSILEHTLSGRYLYEPSDIKQAEFGAR